MTGPVRHVADDEFSAWLSGGPATPATPKPTPKPRRGIVDALGDVLTHPLDALDNATGGKLSAADEWLRGEPTPFRSTYGARPETPAAPSTVQGGGRAGGPGPMSATTGGRGGAPPLSTAQPTGTPSGSAPEGAVSYRDPAAIAQVRVNAQRVAAGKLTTNPSTGQPYTDEDRALASFVDRNLGAREERESAKGGFGTRALDALSLGRVSSDAYDQTLDAGRRGDLATESDLARLGLRTRAGETLRTEPTFGESVKEEMFPAAVGQLPYFIAPIEGIGAKLAGEGLSAIGARSIGEALASHVGEAAEEQGGTLWERTLARARTGATEGVPTGAAVQAATERQHGATGAEAAASAAEGAVIGAPFGAAVSAGTGALGEAVGAGVRAGREALLPRRAPGDLSDLEIPVNVARQPSISNAIDQDIGPQQGPRINPWRQPDTAPRGVSDMEIPFKPQEGAADEANVVVQMEREKAAQAEQLQQEADLQRRVAEHPAIQQEAAARANPGEVDGPVALPEATQQAAVDAKAGDPDATAYHDAVNTFVDATVAARDAGETPSGKIQVALARAKQALNAAREKYGARIGAAAILGLASRDDDLTDDEKKMVGLGGVAMLSTAIVRHIPAETMQLAARTLREAPGDLRLEPQAWYERMVGEANRPDLADGGAGMISHAGSSLMERLSAAVGRSPDGKLSGAEAAAALEQTPSKGFSSRLRTAVDDRQLFGKKWDDVQPAANWIGKLSGSSAFKKEELAFIRPDLERAQAIGQKLSRADVLHLIDMRSPDIERVTLAQQLPAKRPMSQMGAGNGGDYDGFTGDPQDITDLDELVDHAGPVVPHDEIGQQIANRLERVNEIDTHVSDAQEEAETQLARANEQVERRDRELRDTLDSYNLGGNAASRALDYIHEHSYGDEVADARKALSEMVGEIGDQRPDEEILASHGYTVHEEQVDRGYKATWTDADGKEHEEEFTLDPDETEEDAAKYARKAAGGDARTLQVEPTDEGTTEYVVRDHNGKERERGDDREDVIRDAISNDDLSGGHLEEMYERIHQDLSDYADDFAEAQRVESETYSTREEPAEAFGEDFDEKEKLQEEIAQLHTHYTAENDRLTRVAAGTEPARALANPEGLPAGERVADVPAPDAETPETLVQPEVKGSAKWASYQRIGGGSNYRELLNVWGNKKGRPYDLNHYGRDFANVQSHVRVEDHPHYDAPDLTSELPDVRPGDSPEVRLAKHRIAENREQIDSDLELMRDIARQSRQREAAIEKQGGDPLGDQQMMEFANRYSELNSRLTEKSKALAYFYKEIADELGVKPEGHTAVAVEFQSDLAQDALKHGVYNPEAEAKAQDAYDAARDASNNAAVQLEHLLPRVDKLGYGSAFDALDAIYHHDDWATRWDVSVPEVVDAGNAYRQSRIARTEASDQLETARAGIPASPFTDNRAATALGVSRFLIDAAERGHEHIAWSDSANRMAWAHLDAEPARTIYDELVPSAVKRLLAGIGFKDVRVTHTFINGQGHWSVALTRPMRETIKRVGLPIFGALALAALPREQADAQQQQDFDAWLKGQEPPKDRHLGIWATGIGAAVAIGALAYLRKNAGAAALVKASPTLASVMAIAREAAAANRTAGRPEFFPRRAEPTGVRYDAPIDAVTGKNPKPGLFNTPKLGLSPEGDNVWRQVVGQLGLKKKYVSWADTNAEAEVRASAGPADLLHEKPWTGTDALAARLFQSSASERLAAVAKDLNNTTLTAEERRDLAGQFGSLAADIADVAARAAGERESAGRTLNTYKIVARNTLDEPTWQMLATRAKRNLPLTSDEILKIRGYIGDKDRIGLTAFVSKLHRSTPLEKFLTLFKTGLLTGVPTYVAITASNITEAARLAVKEPIAVGLDAVIALARGSQREKALSPRFIQSRIEGFRKGIAESGQILKTGVRPEDIGAWDTRQTNYDSPILQAYTQAVTRSISAVHRPFRTMAVEVALDELSNVYARRAVRADPTLDFKTTREAIRKNPPNDLAAQAIAEGERAAFLNQGTLASMGSGLARAARKLPAAEAALGMVVPFMKIPANIGTRFVDATPLGFVTAALRQMKAGPFDQKQFAEDVAGAMVGSGGLLFMGYALAAQDKATGPAPSSPNDRALWETEGRQPNSVKIGDRWVNVARLGPAGMVIASGAQLHALLKDNPGNATKVVGGMLGTFGRVVTDQSFLKGVSSASEAMSDPMRSGDTFTKSLAGAVVPAGVGRLAAATDSYQRTTTSPMEQIESRVPGLSKRLPPRLTIFGDPVPRSPGGAQALLDPFYTTKAIDEPLVAELRRLDVAVGGAPKTRRLGPERIEYTPAEQREALTEIGPLRRDALERIMALPVYKNAPADAQKKLLKAALDAAEDRYYVQDDRRRLASRGGPR